jgi:molecular chaperone IbpA
MSTFNNVTATLATMMNPRYTVGFEDLFKRMADLPVAQAMGFPPYNVVKVDENTYRIEMAVAGFSRSDIEVTIDGGSLTISGKSSGKNDETGSYLYQGIAQRQFERTFQVADTVKVQGAELAAGILKVWLENEVQARAPRKIEVKAPAEDMIGDKTVKECVKEELARRA